MIHELFKIRPLFAEDFRVQSKYSFAQSARQILTASLIGILLTLHRVVRVDRCRLGNTPSARLSLLGRSLKFGSPCSVPGYLKVRSPEIVFQFTAAITAILSVVDDEEIPEKKNSAFICFEDYADHTPSIIINLMEYIPGS